jgi:hypothetical protein
MQDAAKKPIGIILWTGKSLLDGERIMLVATGVYGTGTKNKKTGSMVQTYVMRRDVHPMTARRMGDDKSICGDCKHREQSTCYVNLCHGPINVFKAFHDGSYKQFEESDLELFKDKYVRVGSYGDPAAVPFEVWDKICSVSKGYTGYTHQWKICDSRLKSICMASVDSIEGYLKEHELAKSMNWRTFRVFADDTGKNIYDVRQENEFVCPASKEAGVKTDCQHCRACSGHSSKTLKDVLINLHADSESMGSMWRRDRYIKMMKKIKNKKAWRRDYAFQHEEYKRVCPF